MKRVSSANLVIALAWFLERLPEFVSTLTLKRAGRDAFHRVRNVCGGIGDGVESVPTNQRKNAGTLGGISAAVPKSILAIVLASTLTPSYGQARGGQGQAPAAAGGAVGAVTQNQQTFLSAAEQRAATLVQAVNGAQSALIVASFAEPRNNAEIRAKLMDLQAAEVALAQSRALSFSEIQGTQDALSAVQVESWIATQLGGGRAGGRGAAGGRGGGGAGGRGGGGGVAGNTIKRLTSEPAGLVALRQNRDEQVRARVERLEAMLTWPGKPGAAAEAAIRPLTANEQSRFQAGKAIYTTTCGACHQPDGAGREGIAPPLRDSEWVLGTESRLVRIALDGVRGPITVKGQNYQLEMPPLSILSDEEIASVLTYLRREWGHAADPLEVSRVKSIRAETASRAAAWTEAELQRLE